LEYEVAMSRDDVTSEILIDQRLESYESFFDHAWGARFLGISEGTLLYEPAYDLCVDWKGIALSSRMSWLMVHSLKHFAHGYGQSNPSFSQRLTRALGQYVADKSSLSNMRRRELLGIVDELGSKVQEEMKNQPSPVEPREVWAEYLKVPEMAWALWSSQRMAYGALYFSFENYLHTAVSIARSEPEYRAFKHKALRDDFANVFGETVAVACIDDPEIEIARLARHCLTHNGGKPSPELKATTHKMRVRSDRLQVFPEDVRGLFSLLTDRALQVANAASSLSVFKQAKPSH
jgi:hypothetical protein